MHTFLGHISLQVLRKSDDFLQRKIQERHIHLAVDRLRMVAPVRPLSVKPIQHDRKSKRRQ